MRGKQHQRHPGRLAQQFRPVAIRQAVITEHEVDAGVAQRGARRVERRRLLQYHAIIDRSKRAHHQFAMRLLVIDEQVAAGGPVYHGHLFHASQ